MTGNGTMDDPDIPVAYGTPLPPPPVNPAVANSVYQSASAPFAPDQTRPTLQSATHLNGGRSSRFSLPSHENTEISDTMIQRLMEQGFTKGLAESLRRNKLAFPMAIWIVDNSGSMQSHDGHRIVEIPQKKQLKFAPSTRWSEMQQTVEYHALMAALLKSPTIFRLLNDPGRAAGEQQFSVAERGDSHIDEDLAVAQQTMLNASPGGVTPLVPHLQEVRNNVLALEPQLRKNGTKVVLVLATDGIPTNDRGISDAIVKQQFVDSLRAFEGLPMWVVVRLCTDEEDVVEFWNSLDEQLELSLEVLDDFAAEAEEVAQHNKWLNYGLPLHRMREMGFHHRLFDMLDERKLGKDELREFFCILFGDGNMDGVPDPEADWKGFYNHIARLNEKAGKTWNPITKRLQPWVDLKQLKKDFTRGWFLF